jgi:hypothetical protein
MRREEQPGASASDDPPKNIRQSRRRTAFTFSWPVPQNRFPKEQPLETWHLGDKTFYIAEANGCIRVTDNEKHFAGLKFINPMRV